VRHFLSLNDLEDHEIADLLERARAVEASPRSDVLRHRVFGLVFFNPSLRTLASSQAAMAQLGGSSFVVTPGQGTWGWEFRPGAVMDGAAAEHVKEAVPVLGQYADVLGVRAFAGGTSLEEDLSEPVLQAFVRESPRPVVNLESAMDHPCQALADWKTLDDEGVPRRGGRLVLSWAYHPKPLPLAVAAATASMAARRGMDVTLLRPEGYEFPSALQARVHGEAAKGGGSFRETDQRTEALSGAHALYVKSFQSPALYGRTEEERALRERHSDWRVSEAWFAPAAPQALFLHCLPLRRNVKVADEVLDGPRSRVIRQAANRLHVQKAVLLRLLGVGRAAAI
jgi:N-acetylornithine carbamoyltransferase